jgi:hypothetical protein
MTDLIDIFSRLRGIHKIGGRSFPFVTRIRTRLMDEGERTAVIDGPSEM